MIKVRGRARLDVQYEVVLNMTEEQFAALSDFNAQNALDAAIDWHSIMGDADVDEIEVDEYFEVEEEK